MTKGVDGKSADADTKPTIDGSNLGPLKKAIQKGVKEIEKLKDDRAACNDAIAAVRSDLKAQGIPKQALDWAMTYLGWDEDKREGFDIAYDIVREALGAPIQAQMFDGVGKPTDDADQSK